MECKPFSSCVEEWWRQFWPATTLVINLRDTGACPHTLSSPVRMISFIAMEYVDQLGAGACTIIFFPCLERDHLLSTNQNAPFIATASISRLSVHVNMPWPRFTFGSPRGFIMIISPHLHKPLPPNIHFIVGECIAGWHHLVIHSVCLCVLRLLNRYFQSSWI